MASAPASSERQSSETSTSDTDSSKRPRIDFERTYAAVKDKRLKVEQIIINGLDRTKTYIVARELEAPLEEATSLEEIKDVLLEAHEHLQALGIFDGVEVIITDSETVLLQLQLSSVIRLNQKC
jgi:outer membrane protein assembly factor BamA